MSVALVTGSGGLIGSEAVRHFAGLGPGRGRHRQRHARRSSSAPRPPPRWNVRRLTDELGAAYTPPRHRHPRPRRARRSSSAHYGRDIAVVIHTAAQPSHDWAVRDPFTDFDVNAGGTLNMLQNVARALHRGAGHPLLDQQGLRRPAQRAAAGRAGDPLGDRRRATRTRDGIREDMSIDACLHSVFGASKVAADVMVQEYGRYFGMRTACFRGGTLTGPAHSADRTARLPRVRDALRHGAPHVQDLRLQGQAGPRRDPQLTTWSTRSRRSSARRAPRRSTTSAAAGTRTAPTSRRSRWPRDHRPAR